MVCFNKGVFIINDVFFFLRGSLRKASKRCLLPNLGALRFDDVCFGDLLLDAQALLDILQPKVTSRVLPERSELCHFGSLAKKVPNEHLVELLKLLLERLDQLNVVVVGQDVELFVDHLLGQVVVLLVHQVPAEKIHDSLTLQVAGVHSRNLLDGCVVNNAQLLHQILVVLLVILVLVIEVGDHAFNCITDCIFYGLFLFPS